MFDADPDLLARSRAYVEATAAPRDQLAAATGLSQRAIDAIADAGGMPVPTYVLYENAIHSPIRDLGAPNDGETGLDYFCPSVLWWLRRAALTEGETLSGPEAWFAQSFAQALSAQPADARVLAWTHLFDGAGALIAEAVAEQVRSLCSEWMNGGWAVCLKRWDGHHVVTKDLERARITAITDDGKRGDLVASERLALFSAIERLDSVILPFSPYERPHGTPGLFIDAMRERYALWG